MAELISVPLKKPSDVEIVSPLKNLIQHRYSTADAPEDYTEAINEFAKLRNNAVWKAFEKFESSLEVIYGYYDQIVALEAKIPPNELQIPFKWKDAFDKGSLFGARLSLTLPSLGFEKVCVLFNIAALQSAVAANQSSESDEGLKLAAKLLQLSAGIFHYLKSTVMLSIQQDPTPDLNPDTLGALSALMLAQAQEIFVHKSIHDNMKESIIAKLAAQCEDLYSEALKIFQRENLKHIWDKDWIPIISGKQAALGAMAEFHQSLVAKASKQIGEEIARLSRAVELFQQANANAAGRSFFATFSDRADRHLAEARKDNDFIYHERIPDIKTLPAIGRAQPAKLAQFGSENGGARLLSQNFVDLFAKLVPVAVHQALAAYDLRRSEIVNGEIGRLREATLALNGVLASLNLPAAIEDANFGGGLPPSILEKAANVKQLGGIEELERMLNELPDSLKRNKEILNETDRLLNEEKQADDSLRQQFKERWNRTPSEKLTEMFRSNLDKYRQIIDNAIKADGVVKEKFETHHLCIQELSRSTNELEAAVPSQESAGSAPNTPSTSINTLRELMERVETIKAERDAIESDLKSAGSSSNTAESGVFDIKEKFLSALARDGAISEAALSVEALGVALGPLQRQVRDTVTQQDDLVAQIREAHTQFVRERGTQEGGREAKMCQLAAAHNAFTELLSHLQDGAKFYNELTQLLLAFQNKVSDYCFARKTEKEELLKDLTQESSRISAAAPNVPAAYNAGPASPPAPSSVSHGNQQQPPASLPYPVYNPSMPVPYGAPGQGAPPYPNYVPPPMPQTYNPYGTYPGAYPYHHQQQQGGPAHPSFPTAGSGYPGQYPPPPPPHQPW